MTNNRLINTRWFVPVFLLLVTLLSFGLLIPWLGFYWDDWAKILVSRLYGLSGYFAYYAEDRPISAWTHILFTPLLGNRPIAWHMFVMVLRWLSAVGFWWCLISLWPRARRLSLVAVTLFLVYPVFHQQAAAVTFHQQWLQYALFFFSLGAMIAARRYPSRYWVWTFASIAAMLLQFSITEYFVPVELVRPLVLWFLSEQAPVSAVTPTRRLMRTLRGWLPYLIPLAAYVIWRLFFIRLSGEDPYRANMLYDFMAQPLATLQKMLLMMLVDEQHILVTSWSELVEVNIPGMTLFSLFAFGTGGLAGVLLVVVMTRNGRDKGAGGGTPAGGDKPAGGDHPAGSREENRFLRQILALGLLAVLLGPVPAWISGRQVVFDFHSDRYALPAMFGAALILTALLGWLIKYNLQRAIAAAVLVGLAVSLHLRVANEYRWIWESQQRIFWQLAWRAPGLKAPTAIFFESEPFPNQGLFSTSAELNLLYPQPRASDPADLALDYWVYTLRPHYQDVPDSLDFGMATQFRTLKFQADIPNSLLVHYDPAHSNCLWVLSERDTNHPYLSDLVKGFLPISNLEQILPEPTQQGYPPPELIGREPEHGWCYYFEKADLAREQGDWETITHLADKAIADGFRPDLLGANAGHEWLPFIEGLAKTGRWEEAASLTRTAFETDRAYGAMLCQIWGNELVLEGATSEAVAALRTVDAEMGCGFNRADP